MMMFLRYLDTVLTVTDLFLVTRTKFQFSSRIRGSDWNKFVVIVN